MLASMGQKGRLLLCPKVIFLNCCYRAGSKLDIKLALRYNIDHLIYFKIVFIMQNEPREYFTIGDNNCGPRAIVQSLLLEGFGNPLQRRFVCDFLIGIFARNKSSELPYARPGSDNRYLPGRLLVGRALFGCSDPRRPYDRINEDVNRLPLNQKGQLEQQVENFIRTYESLATTLDNFNLLVEAFMPLDHGVRATHDHIIYLLAAYVRFDMNRVLDEKTNPHPYVQHFNANAREVLIVADCLYLPDKDGKTNSQNIIEANRILERSVHFPFAICYLATQNIGAQLINKMGRNKVDDCYNVAPDLNPVLFLTILTTGNHFSVQANPFRSVEQHSAVIPRADHQESSLQNTDLFEVKPVIDEQSSAIRTPDIVNLGMFGPLPVKVAHHDEYSTLNLNKNMMENNWVRLGALVGILSGVTFAAGCISLSLVSAGLALALLFIYVGHKQLQLRSEVDPVAPLSNHSSPKI